MSPAQVAVLQALARIVGEEEGGQVPEEVTLKMLVFKWQVGAVMGKRGTNINEIRKGSRANIRVTQPSSSGPVVPCAMEDDELITVRSNLDFGSASAWLHTDELASMVYRARFQYLWIMLAYLLLQR